MELLKNTTDLIGLKDKNISILCARQHPSHIEIKAKLDYTAPLCPHCQGTMIKYDFQKESKIPILDAQGMLPSSNSRSDAFSAKLVNG